MNRLTSILFHLFLAASVLATGCGGGGEDRCVVDEARIAARVECLADDDCPCGTHCSAGVCAYDCRATSDCEAGTCNRFGRCASSAQPAGTLTFSGSTEVHVPTRTVALTPTHPEDVVTLGLDPGRTSGPVRIRTTGDVRITCPVASTGLDCVVWPTDSAPLAIPVTADDVAIDGSGTIEITTDFGTETVAVTTGEPTPPTAQPLDGRWEGSAYFVGARSQARPVTTLPSQALAELPFRVAAVIHPEVAGVRPMELTATDAIVFPESPTIGELRRGSDDALQVRHARRPFVETAGAEGANLLASAVSTEVTRTQGTLALTLRTTYFGATTDATSPEVEWRIVLHRVGDLPEGSTPPVVAADASLGSTTTRASVALQIETAAASHLVDALAGVTSETDRAQRVLCTAYDGAAGSNATFDSTVPTSGWSGDLLCESENGEDFAPRALGPYSATSFDLATTIPGCVADLARMLEARNGTLPTGSGSGCIDGPRLALALVEATKLDRERAGGSPVSPNVAASALGHRLIQQWSAMLAFVAAQAVQMDRLNDVLGDGVGSTGIERNFSQNDMLERASAGWDLLLHPRVATALMALPGSVIVRADYRTRIFPSETFPNVRYQDQGVGAPVAIASALARTIDAHAAILDRSRYVTRDLPRAIELSHSFARRSVVLFSMAAAMTETARAAAPGDLEWQGDWERASNAYGDALTRLLRALELAREGGNPLGIDDTLDLPLYRVGDETNALGRFSALTDYLLGSDGSGDTSPAGSAVAAAEASRETARVAFSQALVRNFAEETEESLTNRRIAAVSLGYGGDLQSLCGDPDLDPDAAVAGEVEVDENTCWIRPDCRRTGAEAVEAAQPSEIARGLCMWRRLHDRAGAVLGVARDDAATLATASIDALLAGTITVRGQTMLPDGGATVTFSDGGTLALGAGLIDGSGPTLDPRGDLPNEDLAAIDAECRAVGGSSETARPGEAPNACTLHGDCPSGYLCRTGTCHVDVATDAAPACYRGYVGELVIALRGAITDIEVARSAADEVTERYRIRMQQCTALIESNDAREAAVTSLNQTLHDMAAARLAMQIAANVARSTKDCSEATKGADVLVGGALTCAAAIAEGTFESVVNGLDFGMEEAQRKHDTTMAMLDAALAERTCALEADYEMVGLNTAALGVRRATESVQALLVQLENAKNQIRVTLRSGRSEYARELADAVPPIEFDYWLNTTAVEYDAAFRRARRGLYLGVLALEYEYQLSSSERTAVLSATGVSELRASLTRLRNLAATGTVGGAAPSPLLAVVSLRDELLALDDRSQGDPGGQGLTDIERFRVLLASSRFARHAPDGTYLGQEIPFRLAPFSAAGEMGAVPILAGEDCAERIWSMNASILGTNILVGSDSTRTRITLRKRNTFFSQWCAPGVSTEFAVAATRPSRNLFLDPTTDFIPSAFDPRTGTFDELHEADAFASARLQPVLGVTRAELEADSYFNGASRELAGRGLYGDYTLFIPAESLTRDGTPGVDLSRVDDVLLRFDYVSVAR